MTIKLRFPMHQPLPVLILRFAEYCCFGVGFALLGLCAVLASETYFFQTYENWAFDQHLERAPASYAEFLAEKVSFVAKPAIRPLAGSDRNFGAPEFQPSADRSVVGRIEIPRIGLATMVLEGVSQRTLALAVGHIPGTALPGEVGNVGIAGHRDTFFRSLRDVHPGDTIVMRTLQGSWEYRVQSCEVVHVSDTQVLEDSGSPALTLVTCYPFYYVGPAPERFIVHALRITS